MLNAITAKVSEPHPRNVPTLVIYFDDAHVLHTPVLGPNTSETIYDALCSSIDYFTNKSLLVLFMSTTSKLERFALPFKLARSARLSRTRRLTAQPITEIPFDFSPDLPLLENVEMLASVADVKFMSRFGRAL